MDKVYFICPPKQFLGLSLSCWLLGYQKKMLIVKERVNLRLSKGHHKPVLDNLMVRIHLKLCKQSVQSQVWFLSTSH